MISCERPLRGDKRFLANLEDEARRMDAVVRPARREDRKPLMRFIRHVWEGHDYIPRVWDRWLESKDGQMFVVEVDGAPVGMNRVRFMEDGSAWFEGVRVHPDFRGEGLASMLGENSMRVAKERGVGVFRLTSGSRNRSAHRQIARMNFREASRISVYAPRPGARFSPQKEVMRASVRELPEVTRLVRGSDEFRLGSGVYWSAFAAEALTPRVIERLVREARVWKVGSSVAIAKDVTMGSFSWKEVCFLAGRGEEPLKLVRHEFGLKSGVRPRWRIVYLPQGSNLIGALRRAGFVRDSSLVLFERSAANG